MKFRQLHLLVFLLVSIPSLLSSQTLSEVEMSAWFNTRMREISRDVYMAAWSGKITAYHSDSLTMVLTQNMVNMMGARLFPRPSDPLKADTIRFHPDSLTGNPAITFQTTYDQEGACRSAMLAVAPQTSFTFGNNVQMLLPMFFVKVSDLKGVLRQDQLDLLSVYAQFVQSEPKEWLLGNNRINHEGLMASWDEVISGNRETKSGATASKLIMSWVIGELKGPRVFRKFTGGQLKLSDASGVVTSNGFIIRHKRRFDVQMPKEDNPAVLKDTFYFQIPDRFDSVALRRGKDPAVMFMMRGPGTSGVTTYTCRLADLRTIYPAQIIRILDILAKD